MFIDGVVAVCQCGRELTVPEDVARTAAAYGGGYSLHLVCSCKESTTLNVGNDILGQAAAALRRRKLGQDVAPLSEEEHMLKMWGEMLEMTEDLVAAIGGEPSGANA